MAVFIGSPGMNFIPCSLEASGQGLVVRLSDGTPVPVSADQTARYQDHAGRQLELGLRPEHVTEHRGRTDAADVKLSVIVVEPMGMETLLHGTIAGSEATSRIDPVATPNPGDVATLSASMTYMHLLDPESGKVL